MERAAARERERRAQRDMARAINDANREVTEMKDKAHADIMENQRNKDLMLKESIKTMEANDAANTEKLEMLTNIYQSIVKETLELAKQREEELDLKKINPLPKEERERMTNDYLTMIEEIYHQLSRNQQEKDAKMDELNKIHLADLREAHDNFNRLQETSKAEERSEILMNNQRNEELAPIKSIKSSLIDNATESCDLWIQMQESEKELHEIEVLFGLNMILNSDYYENDHR
ncbi:hypothetical protein PENTCL1PPCAC_8549 [Pristionchus entomophagus]|uniref:Uncharacterized protein n=1 Tax=Pristionchus entomophagus TaxID=358040 RepID=A0AAV5SU08_9BILA|nr:hypothetical protein PENTCL1PPCAC_8549 [Pristionchus entomophagus]